MRRLLKYGIKLMIAAIFGILSLPKISIMIFLYKIKLMRYLTATEWLSKKPGLWGIIERRIFYKLTLTRCGKSFKVGFGSILSFNDIEIGDHVTIEDYCILGRCIIGNDVILASRVTILSGGHQRETDDTGQLWREMKVKVERTILGSNLWIGTHAVVMHNIGDNSAVGAGSVVTKPIEANVVCAGVPAKIIKYRKSRHS